MTDDLIFVVMPADNGVAPGIPGSLIITAECGHRAWVSQAGLATALRQNMRITCEDCVDATADVQVEVPLALRHELGAEIGPRRADGIITTVQANPQRALRVLQTANALRRRGRHRG